MTDSRGTDPQSSAFKVFRACCEAIQAGRLIDRVSRTDKEFHFQNWFKERLIEAQLLFDEPGRNSYPDFPLVTMQEGYEIKGLQWPGRDANYDANSQVPSGFHNGRSIYYVFGRYPVPAPEDTHYPVIDLVVCHGDFLNADHDYEHKNRNVKGFGSYGDIMIRDRKMYVVPTPFAIAQGLTGRRTLIVPETQSAPEGFTSIANVERCEAANLVAGYAFDLRTNDLRAQLIPNPAAGKVHKFVAYRVSNDASGAISIAP